MSPDRAERVRATGRGAPVDDPNAPAPTEERLPDGQHADHWVLSEKQRAKGFVRPVRSKYRHVGPSGPAHPTRPLTAEEAERYERFGYVSFEPYPESEGPATGRFWTQEQLDRVQNGGCGGVTTMGKALAETIARDPSFYGSTFCAHCHDYFPIGETGEFVWEDDGSRMGT